MDHLSQHDKKKFKRLEREKARVNSMVHNPGKPKLPIAPIAIVAGMALVIVAVVLASKLIAAQPGKYDSFAKCLSEKGVVMYGNDWCQYTALQKQELGKSMPFINYQICDEIKPGCQNKGVRITPTWEINGTLLSGVQELALLSQLSGCPLP